MPRSSVVPLPAGCSLWYQKHMTHHLLPGMDIEWVHGLTNVFLIRDPAAVVDSYLKSRATVVPDDIGLRQQLQLFDAVTERLGEAPPVIDADAPVPANDPDGVVIIGAVVVAYAQTAQQAQMDKRLLGTEIAYYDDQRVVATSFTKNNTNEEDTAKAGQLSALVKAGKAPMGTEWQPMQFCSMTGATF